jgi:hypothetical protein
MTKSKKSQIDWDAPVELSDGREARLVRVTGYTRESHRVVTSNPRFGENLWEGPEVSFYFTKAGRLWGFSKDDSKIHVRNVKTIGLQEIGLYD